MLPRYTLCARNAAAIGRQFLLRTITTQILQVSTGQVLPVLGLVRQCGTQASVEACIAIGERERRDEAAATLASDCPLLSRDLRKRRRSVARLICLVSGP